MNTVATTDLGAQELDFVKNFILGMTRTQAAKAAGYLDPEAAGQRLMRNKAVIAELEREQAAFRNESGVTRGEVVEIMKDAIEMARTMADPQTMVAGARELGRMLGYYAPEKKQVQVDVRGAIGVQQLEALPDDELVKLIEGERVIDAVPALPAPEDA